jgi:hypothetical protein
MDIIRQPIEVISGERDRLGRVALDLACGHTSYTMLEGHYRVGDTRYCLPCSAWGAFFPKIHPRPYLDFQAE